PLDLDLARRSSMNLTRATFIACALAFVGAAGVPAPVAAETTLRVVMHSDLKIIDPIWTTAYIVRNHGYMIYDTLFAMDAKGEIRPQMVDKYEVSKDQLTYTITLRDGLSWHDGKPVTTEDCVASIKRWSAKDSMGQKLMGFVKDIQIVNAKTFKIVLNEPTGLVLGALGKPSSNVPFMMPKRVAETDPNTQISDFTGSGPFVFKKDEWKPGDKAVYARFDKYRPRLEPPSALAGGKVVKVDRVEWKWIPDHQTAMNALIAGEVEPEGPRGAAGVELRKVPGAAEGSGLRRHADRVDALHRPCRAHQPRAGCQVAPREGRLQGGHGLDGLADAGRPAREKGAAGRRRLARVPHLMGRRRHPQSRHDGLHERLLRQGDVRLAVRQGDREPARPVRARDQSGPAEGDRRGGAGAGDAVSDPYPARPVVPAVADAQERRRRHPGPRAGLLERHQEVS